MLYLGNEIICLYGNVLSVNVRLSKNAFQSFTVAKIHM